MSIMNALQAAIYVKPTCQSIAIPGMSLGEQMQFPVKRSARLMLEMCINWATLVNTNGIRHIKLMNMKAEEHEACASEMDNI